MAAYAWPWRLTAKHSQTHNFSFSTYVTLFHNARIIDGNHNRYWVSFNFQLIDRNYVVFYFTTFFFLRLLRINFGLFIIKYHLASMTWKRYQRNLKNSSTQMAEKKLLIVFVVHWRKSIKRIMEGKKREKYTCAFQSDQMCYHNNLLSFVWNYYLSSSNIEWVPIIETCYRKTPFQWAFHSCAPLNRDDLQYL